MTVDQLLQLIQTVDEGADVVLPVAGVPELVPLVDAVAALASKITQAVAGKQQDPLSLEIAAGDAVVAAAKAAARLK